jgi:hypothetical protein
MGLSEKIRAEEGKREAGTKAIADDPGNPGNPQDESSLCRQILRLVLTKTMAALQCHMPKAA